MLQRHDSEKEDVPLVSFQYRIISKGTTLLSLLMMFVVCSCCCLSQCKGDESLSLLTNSEVCICFLLCASVVPVALVALPSCREKTGQVAFEAKAADSMFSTTMPAVANDVDERKQLEGNIPSFCGLATS